MPNLVPCDLCPKNSKSGIMIPKVIKGEVLMLCQHHEKHPEEKIDRTDVTAEKKAAKAKKLTQAVWYKMQLQHLLKKCECCNGKLTKPADLPDRTFVAHILDKRPAAR